MGDPETFSWVISFQLNQGCTNLPTLSLLLDILTDRTFTYADQNFQVPLLLIWIDIWNY